MVIQNVKLQGLEVPYAVLWELAYKCFCSHDSAMAILFEYYPNLEENNIELILMVFFYS